MPRTAIAQGTRTVVNRTAQAVTFNGSTQYLVWNAPSAYNLVNYSIEFWVNAASSQASKEVFIESASNINNPFLRILSGSGGDINRLRVSIRNDAGTFIMDATSATVVYDATWHHVVLSDANGTATMYIDKVADATNFNYTRTGTLTGMNRTTLGAQQINGSFSNFLTGSLALFRVYNIALNQTQVNAAYANNSGVPRANLTYELLFINGKIAGKNPGFVTVASPTFSSSSVPPTSVTSLAQGARTALAQGSRSAVS